MSGLPRKTAVSSTIFSASTAAAERIAAAIQQDAVEPGVEAADVTQPWQVHPCRGKRLLDGVERVGLIAENGARSSHRDGKTTLDEGRERLMVALTGAPHQGFVGREAAELARRPTFSVLDSMTN
jgi:hypothetical protein